MRQHKDLAIIDADRGIPIDRPLDRITLASSKSMTDKRRGVTLSKTAAFLLKSRAIRSEQFRDIFSDIDDISWHILLDLRVAAISERPTTAHDLAIAHNVAMNTMSRYVKYLIRVGLIDHKIDALDEGGALLKLTASGNALTSKVLRKINRELANF